MDAVVPQSGYAIEEFCRLCATESNKGIPIYSIEGQEQCLEEKINYCFRIAEFLGTQLDPESIIKEIKDENNAKPNDSKPDNLLMLSSENNIDSVQFGNLLVDNIEKSKNIDESEPSIGTSNLISSNLEGKFFKVKFSKAGHNKIKTKKIMKSHETSDSEDSFNAALDSNDDFEEEDVNNMLQDEDVKEEIQNHLGIKCNQCNIVISSKSQFDSHYRSSYNKKPVYTCSFCNKIIENYSTFRSHCYRHLTEGRYRCEYCNKGFYLRNLLNLHIAAKHTEVKPFNCESCGKGFVTQTALNTHIKSHKGIDKEEFPCKECGKILYTRGGLTSHINAHKLGRRFMCDLCGKTFTQKVNMQHHVKLHSGERPYTCEKCGRRFAEKSQLNRHYSLHSDKRPFKCPICSKMYKTERCLKVHNMVHAEVRPFVCSYCSKGFLSITKLKQHCNIHTGERPFKCRYCERTFTNSPNWLKHTRRRHKVDHRTGLSINIKEQTEKEEIIPPICNFTLCDNNELNVNSNIGADIRQNGENPSLNCITFQTFSYSSYMNHVPSPISQVYSDQNLITHMTIPSQQMLPL